MKQAVTYSYTFDPLNNKLTLTIPNFSIRRLYAVINLTANNKVIFASGGGSALGISSNLNGLLMLNANLTGMSSTDDLLILYDAAGTRKAEHSVAVTPATEQSALDVPGFLVRGQMIEELLGQMLVEQRLTNMLLLQGLSISEPSLDALRADLAQQ